MRILITGSSGMVGQELQNHLFNHVKLEKTKS